MTRTYSSDVNLVTSNDAVAALLPKRRLLEVPPDPFLPQAQPNGQMRNASVCERDSAKARPEKL